MSRYNLKLHMQKNEIKRLRAERDSLEKQISAFNLLEELEDENKRLKKDLEYWQSEAHLCDLEAERLKGQNEAWELARKIAVIPKEGEYFHLCELLEIFNTGSIIEIFSLTCPEAAAKVEAWEKTKEEPLKGTILSDFLEKYPNAQINSKGVPITLCPYTLGYGEKPKECSRHEIGCFDCWRRPLEQI